MARSHCRTRDDRDRRRGFLWRWFVANTFVSGACALLWLLLRSGARPSRLAYPCQQAAIGAASLAFGGPAVAALIAARRNLRGWIRRPAVLLIAATGLLLAGAFWGLFLRAQAYSGQILDPPREYRATIYHVAECPESPAGDRLLGLDNLIGAMGAGGLKFYESATVSPVAGPEGIIGADDVVVLKINYQWGERGGTNTDLLRGLIRRIVDHPDGFAGEVIVCENSQFNSIDGFDRPLNNAEDHGLSPHDVVVHFQSEGYSVSHFDWTVTRYTSVTEFDAGNYTDGYVVSAYDADLHGRVSYPKFTSAAGTRVSLKRGVWDEGSGSYDRDKLKFVNLPVLKSHHATYGATVAVKHYMGVVTRELSTNSHGAIHYGIMGALMGEIQMADLNIVDAIWVNANPFDGPWTSYAGATRRNELLAGVDPVALDIWAVRNILIPAFESNGYSPPWPSPSADPDLPSSAFRQYLDNSMYQLLAAGYDVTNDPASIDVASSSGGAGDFDGDGDVDLLDFNAFEACFTGEDGGPVDPGCAAGDFDGDGDIDCSDWERFRWAWTSPGAPPTLPDCLITGVSAIDPRNPNTLWPAYPNPANPTVDIRYAIERAGAVTLTIYDAGGRSVRILVEEFAGPGRYEARWDGLDGHGSPVASGVYSYRLESAGFRAAGRLVLLR